MSDRTDTGQRDSVTAPAIAHIVTNRVFHPLFCKYVATLHSRETTDTSIQGVITVGSIGNSKYFTLL